MIQLPERLTEDFIKRRLLKGDVLFWENYKFKNGSKKTSRFVILTDCKNDSFLAIRATGNIEFYEKPSSLHREFIKLSANEESLFTKLTVLDLNKIFVLNIREMKRLFGEQIKRPNRISDDTLNKLEELVANSKILRKDWIGWILNSKKSEFLTEE